MSPLEVRTAIERSWSATTTFCPDGWEERDPAWGQCGVTAVLLVDCYGGDLRRGTAVQPDGWSTTHYWAVVDGVEVDLTWRQFPVGTAVHEPVAIERRAILANRWMVARFDELRGNFAIRRRGRELAPWRQVGHVTAARATA